MDITLHQHETPEDAAWLAPLLDEYARAVTDELRDDPLPAGVGEALLERVFGGPEGVAISAHVPGQEAHIGYVVTGPLEDPLVGDRSPMVLALWVDRDMRHRGLARSLVLRAREVLAERGFTTLAARAGHNDDALISMGERWGFVRSYEVMVYEP
jgi:GNAT superfamily N-acetyltransferase